MICPVCRSTDFYQDDEMNVYFCSRCQTQSQELFAESFEIEDGNMAMLTRLEGGSKKERKTIRKTRPKKVIVRVEAPDPALEDVLACYQFCLKLIASQVADIIKSSTLEGKVRSLWFQYLEAWRRSGKKILHAFKIPKYRRTDYDADYFSGPKLPHPIFPTKHLIYGFVYLALRLERSWVVPGDLIRWIKAGRVVYSALWEAIPSELTEPLPWTFGHPYRYNKLTARFLTTTNVFFHTYILAEGLEVVIPPLNAPLVARGFFASLRLPPACWTAFCSILQLFRPSYSPLKYLDLGNEHYPENVMAACIVAMKLVRGWTSWEYVHIENESETFYMPENINELDFVRREDLDALLTRLRSSLSTVEFHVMNRGYGLGLAAVLEEEGKELWDSFYAVDSSVQSPAIALHGHALMDLDRLSADEKYLKWLNCFYATSAKESLFNPVGAQFQPYLHHTESVEDKTGLLHPQYVVLLERCAKHLCTAPGLLHVLVSRIDIEIVAILNEQKKNAVRAEVHRLSHLCERRWTTFLSVKRKRSSFNKRRKCLLRLRRGLPSSTNESEVGRYRSQSWRVQDSLRDLALSGFSVEVEGGDNAAKNVNRSENAGRAKKDMLSQDFISPSLQLLRRERNDSTIHKHKFPPQVVKSEPGLEETEDEDEEDDMYDDFPMDFEDDGADGVNDDNGDEDDDGDASAADEHP